MNGTASLIKDVRNDLRLLIDMIVTSPAFKAKQDIRIASELDQSRDPDDFSYFRPGDDCAALEVSDGYQLFAMEGMSPDFVRQEPWHAGFSSVLANVSDVAAMGGRPTGIVNAYWHNDVGQAGELLAGIKKACDVFNIGFAGGHSSISQTNQPGLAVAIIGHARSLLSCHNIKPGQRLFMVTDLNGKWHGDFPYWNTLSGKSHDKIRANWELLPDAAESGLICAAKDISNSGILGSLLMMLELSGLGAKIDINAVPLPAGELNVFKWFSAFQSYGFIIASEMEMISPVINHFHKSELNCTPIGTVMDHNKVILDCQGYEEEFWDFSRQGLCLGTQSRLERNHAGG